MLCVSASACAPDFVLIGTGHAASTSLYALLVQHPQLLPARVKELNFAGLHTHWLARLGYAKLFPHAALQRPGQLTGEASPYYLTNPVAPHILRYLAPRAKLVLVLRAPPSHCWSASSQAVLHAYGNVSSSGQRCPTVVEASPSRVLASYHPCAPNHYSAALPRPLECNVKLKKTNKQNKKNKWKQMKR